MDGVKALAITTAGTGYTNGVAVALAFAGGGGSGAAGTATVAGGAVTAVALTSRGSGYTSAPTVTINGDAGNGDLDITATVGSKWGDLTLSRELADADTDDYYNGMRLYITGGGASNDGTKLSAKGQSCRITDYTAAHETTPSA